MEPEELGIIGTDTRLLGENQWYVALCGEKFDGHDFLGDAYAAGAVGAIVQERPAYAIGNQRFALIAVEDTLTAYQALARNWRKRISPKVVAITGSSGKTTTKEMAAAVFSEFYRCHFSAKNENNEIGVPKTILSMPDDTQVLILEMAMRGLKQIDELARCALPDIGIITNVGVAHIELLGSRENIAIAKCELLEHLSAERGLAILGEESPLLRSRAAKVFAGHTICFNDGAINIVDISEGGTIFRLNDSPQDFFLPAHGMPLVADAWSVIQGARKIGLSDQDIAQGLRNFKVVGGRGNRLSAPSGAVVLDESYNANPDSVRAAIEAMIDERAFPQSKKIAVLGELAELGEQTAELMHDLGSWLKEKPLKTIILVGEKTASIARGAEGAAFELLRCPTMIAAEEELKKRLDQDTCVLVKGSRAAKLDELVRAITN